MKEIIMNKKLLTLFVVFLFTSCIVSAQNPIIRNQFTADPTARVFNGKIYLYPSHDIPAPEGQRQDWFCMEDYHVFSSENLTDWTDHGMIVTQNKVPWGKPDGYSMWAPDCVYKNGKYYFYFPNAPKTGRGFAIGVATADHPEGPFTCEPTAIKGVFGIDPCVLIDDDGQAYLYWSVMGIRGTKLKDNMKETADTTASNAPQSATVMQGLPDGFKEGPFVFKRDNYYYLTFPWVRKENGTETLAYAMSKNPLGPWDFKGIIMAEHDNTCWTNHHSILQYKGQWYIFYHRNDFSPKMDKRRSARIEKLFFNQDGTIQEVQQTMRGVGVNQATEKIEVDRYRAASKGVTTEYVDTTDYFRGWYANLPQKGSWMKYTDVDFNCIHDGYLVICVSAEANTTLFVREKNEKGKIIARVKVVVENENGPFRRDIRGQWITLTAPLEYTPKGITDLCVTCEDKSVNVDWLQFKNRPKYFSPSSKPLLSLR